GFGPVRSGTTRDCARLAHPPGTTQRGRSRTQSSVRGPRSSIGHRIRSTTDPRAMAFHAPRLKTTLRVWLIIVSREDPTVLPSAQGALWRREAEQTAPSP